MKILLDECVDWRLSRDLVGHHIKTAVQMGWAGSKNGELLTHASEQFNIFITVDRSLSYQQGLAAFSIAVVVLASKSNRLADLTKGLGAETLDSDQVRQTWNRYCSQCVAWCGRHAQHLES